MNKYSKLSKTVQSLGAIILRGQDLGAKDLDIYVSKDNAKKVDIYLHEQGFIHREISKNNNHYYKFKNDQFYFVDVIYNYNYFFYYFYYFDPKLREPFIHQYLLNMEKFYVDMKILRYLFQLRNSKKYLDFLLKHHAQINNEFLNNRVRNNPFKRIPTKKELVEILNKNIFTFFKIFGFSGTVKIICSTVRKKIYSYKAGKIVSIIGIDGVGKTTIISILNSELPIKNIYLGAGDYKSKFLIDRLKNYNNSAPAKLLYKFILYLEHWFKILFAYSYKLFGFIVVLDRHPYYDSLGSNRVNGHTIFNCFFYRILFPKGDIAIILTADPKQIYERKQEKNPEQIKSFYMNLFNKISGNHIIINNDNLDESLNSILKILYE